MKAIWPCAIALVCLLAGGKGVQADIIEITSSQDNTLIAVPSKTSQQLSDGSGPALFVGETNQSSSGQVSNISTRRGLIQFDLSAIPVGSQINSVSLTLHQFVSAGKAETISLFAVSQAWGQGASFTGGGAGANAQAPDATWFYSQYQTNTWTNPGGDFSATASASALANTTTITWSSTVAGNQGMLQDIQNWVDNSASNFGWLLQGDESQLGTAHGYYTREGPAGLQPELTIDFTVVPEPSTISLAIIGGFTIVSVGRRKLKASKR